MEKECAAAVQAASGVNPEEVNCSDDSNIEEATTPTQDQDNADDLDDYEALPFNEYDSDPDLFHDAGTWSEDEEGNVTNAEL